MKESLKPAELFRVLDHEQWRENILILGYEIRLSGSSKKGANCELCKQLCGNYPKWFKWIGWHDGCICFKIPILMERDIFAQYNKLIAQGKDTKSNVERLLGKSIVKKPPSGFIKWAKENIKAEHDISNTPNWIKENYEQLKPILKIKL